MAVSAMLSIKDINALPAGASLAFRDMTSLEDYAATADVTPNQSVTITSNAAGSPVTYPLTRDQSVQFPIFQLN